jgi:hypothetical protein
MYGKGYDEVLEAQSREIKKFTRDELLSMTADYKQRTKELEG